MVATPRPRPVTAPAMPGSHKRCGARADPGPRVSKPIDAKRIALESNLCSNDGMRWNGQQVGEHGVGAAQTLPGLDGLLRTVRTPEFAGMVFHEVEARSALNRVPGVVADAVPVDGQPVPRLRARLRLLPRRSHPRVCSPTAAPGRSPSCGWAMSSSAPSRSTASAATCPRRCSRTGPPASPPTPCASRVAPSWSPAASTASSPRTGGGTSAPGGAAPGGAPTCGPGRRCSGPDRSVPIVRPRRPRRTRPGTAAATSAASCAATGPTSRRSAWRRGARSRPPPAGRSPARTDRRRDGARPHRPRRAAGAV